MRPAGRLPLIALCALAALLRFATLDVQSFDFDEAYSVARVLDGSLVDVLATLPETEASPPLHYALAWLWTRPFGLGEVGLRSLSALAGTAVVPLAYAAGSELASRRAGLVAAALVAVNPFLVWYSQEGRTYALLTLLGALSFWAFVRVLAQPSNYRLAAWAGACALALLSHYFAVFLFAAEAVWLLGRGARRRAVLVATAAVAAVGAALLPLAVRQADVRTEWITGEPLPTRARQVVSKFLLGEVDPVSDLALVLFALVVAALLALGLRLGGERERRAALVATAVGGGSIAIALVLDALGQRYLLARNVVAALPVLAVAAGALLAGPSRGRSLAGDAGTGHSHAGHAGRGRSLEGHAGRGRSLMTDPRAGRLLAAGAAAVCAAMLAIVVAGAIDPRLQRPDYRAAAEVLRGPRGDLAVVSGYFGGPPLEVYAPGMAQAGPGGVTASELELLEPLTRRDSRRPARPPTPPPPPGFTTVRRDVRDTFTRVVYRAERPAPVNPAVAEALSPRLSDEWVPLVLFRPPR